MVKRLNTIFQPSNARAHIRDEHRNDARAKWFGIMPAYNPDGGTSDGAWNLAISDRYESIMIDGTSACPVNARRPRLVSFVGVTNAGKSTLIKSLVRTQDSTPEVHGRHLSPVAGRPSNDSCATSGDVHLYADPRTFHDECPILFADSEGFEGGEIAPEGSLMKSGVPFDIDSDTEVLRARTWQPIAWTTTPETRRREYVITRLFPRLLYTFSDCVVFVLRNPKTFQSTVLPKLLEWGRCVSENAINQTILPHCLVVLNCSPDQDQVHEWSTEHTTQMLLGEDEQHHLRHAENVPYIKTLADRCRSQGRRIASIGDLIKCYYRSFNAIRIPEGRHYAKLHQQVTYLYHLINERTHKSIAHKREAFLPTGSDDVQRYYRSAFQHFTTDLAQPFNSFEQSAQQRSLPTEFEGHVGDMCSLICAKLDANPVRLTGMLRYLRPLLVTTLLRQCVRQRQGPLTRTFEQYQSAIKQFLRAFISGHVRCSYSDGKRHCVQPETGHGAGNHCDHEGIIEAGEFISPLRESEEPLWMAKLAEEIGCLEKDFAHEISKPGSDECRASLDIHRKQLSEFHRRYGPIVSHTSCFGCLVAVPEHPIACGHILCEGCVLSHGTSHGTKLSISYCPLACVGFDGASASEIRLVPPSAGLRVLALEGGGWRTVVQLEILSRAELLLGHRLSVADFFDLVVGTGSGAIASTLLAKTNSTATTSLENFRQIWTKACPSSAPSVWARLMPLRASSQSERLYQQLRTTFGGEVPFFGASDQFRPGLKAAVTCTGLSGKDTIVIANYKRHDLDAVSHKFERARVPKEEFWTWEAIGAAAAHPPHYKPFQRGNKVYLDGSLSTHPIISALGEAHAKWGMQRAIDIVLLIGTGLDMERVVKEGQRQNKRRARDELRAKRTYQSREDWYFNIADFRAQHGEDERIVQWNPEMPKGAPGVWSNDTAAMDTTIASVMGEPWVESVLKNIVGKLVASIFYCHWESGEMACRFEANSEELKHLGDFFLSRRSKDFAPHFAVGQAGKRRKSISEEMCYAMKEGQEFRFSLDVLLLCPEDARDIRFRLYESTDEKDIAPLVSGLQGPLLANQRNRANVNQNANLRTTQNQRELCNSNMRSPYASTSTSACGSTYSIANKAPDDIHPALRNTLLSSREAIACNNSKVEQHSISQNKEEALFRSPGGELRPSHEHEVRRPKSTETMIVMYRI